MKRKLTYLFLASLLVSGCVNTPRHYRAAGFDSSQEAQEYIANYIYYSGKIEPQEWKDFYQRFPEYWRDIQNAKVLGSTMEFHPWYTAYAFKWTTNNRKASWSPQEIARLDAGTIEPGDDIFKVVYAKGPPRRVIWDNDFEITLYEPDVALIFKEGTFFRQGRSCDNCWNSDMEGDRMDIFSAKGMEPNDVIRKLGLKRPLY